MKTKKFYLFSFIIFFVSIFSFQNCSMPFGSSFKTGSDSYSSSAEATNTCMKSNNTTCLFNKNSVYAANAPVTDYILGAYLNFGVQLTTLSSDGFLFNDSIRVQTLVTDRKQIHSLKSYPTQNESSLEQAMAYYYINEAVSFYARKGPWSASSNDLVVYVDSNYSGYDASTKSIHLKKESTSRSTAYDASLILFYLNQANAVLASSEQILGSLASTAKNCFNTRNRLLSNGCCTTSEGCGAALYLAQADYLTALFFHSKGQSPAIAETYVNKTTGASSCGISRDPSKNSTVTFSKAYNACSSSKGLNSAMAGAYSSIWWEVRKTLIPSDQNEFDQLFLEHIKELKGSMTFTEAIQAALQIDQSSHSGKFNTRLQSELNRRK